jgi:exocyst complex component 5
LAEYDLAILLKNLLLISAELDMSQTKVAKANIERMSSQLERSQLDRFVQAAAEKKYAVMQETARILFEFNGGDTCIREYINRLGVFLNIEELKNYKIYEPPPPPPPLQKGQKPPIEPPPGTVSTNLHDISSQIFTPSFPSP